MMKRLTPYVLLLLVLMIFALMIWGGAGAKAATYSNNFDGNTVGTLPAGWSNGSPSGPGVAAGAFAVNTQSPVSAPNAFGDATDSDIAVYTALASDDVQFDTVASGTNGDNYSAISAILRADATGTNHYLADFNPITGGLTWYRHDGGGYTSLNNASLPTWANGAKLSVRLRVNGSNLEFYVWAQGTAPPGTPSATQALDGVLTTTGYCGFRVSRLGTATTASVDNVVIIDPAKTVVFADDANLVYVGKWAKSGAGATAKAVTLNSGSEIKAALAGTHSCQLNFDTSNCAAGQYADVVYQINGGAWTRTTLTGTGSVTCAFPTFSGVSTASFAVHSLRVVIEGAFDAGTTPVDVWGGGAGRVQFTGLSLDSGGFLLPTQPPANAIEFDGDSITDTVRLLGAGSYSQTLKAAHLGWPTLTAQALGLAPVVAGYPGIGLVKCSNGSTAASASGVPLPAVNFGSVYAGQSYSPSVKPLVVVVAYGANDQAQGVSSASFQSAYQSYLTTIRAAYPLALIECLILPSSGNYAGAIPSAVAAQGDARIKAHDYSALASNNAYTTSDGTHPDLAGGVTLAAQLARDIQSDLTALGVKYQAAAGGTRRRTQ